MGFDNTRDRPISRRTHLKLTGAGIASMAALAGCTGGGDGGGGGGGDGGDGGSTDLTQTSFVIPPVGLSSALPMGYLTEQTDTFEEYMNEEGYTVETNATWDVDTLFASRQFDISTMDVASGTSLAQQQDRHLTFFGSIATAIHGVFVQAGGPYDPETTGGLQATFDKIVEDGGTFGINGWEDGTNPVQRKIIQERWGYEFSEDGDFDVATSSYSTLPQLIAEGEIAVGTFTSTNYAQFDNKPEVTSLFWLADEFINNDWGIPPLVDLTVHTDFYEEHPGACRATLRAWRDALTWEHENAEELIADPEIHELIGVDNEEEARTMFEYQLLMTGPQKEGGIWEVPDMTSERIEGFKQVLETFAADGFIGDDWADRGQFVTPSDMGM